MPKFNVTVNTYREVSTEVLVETDTPEQAKLEALLYTHRNYFEQQWDNGPFDLGNLWTDYEIHELDENGEVTVHRIE